MTGPDTAAATGRVLELLADPPELPETAHGYLDLLGGDRGPAQSPIQSLWSSWPGALAYDGAQALLRAALPPLRLPGAVRAPREGATVLDVGCGPGNVTAELGRAVGPSGLAVGLDVSGPMLERAARDHGGRQVGFLRADAERLPFSDATFDQVTGLLSLQLIPDPQQAIGEFARVAVPGGPVAVLVPTDRFGPAPALSQWFPAVHGLTIYDAEDLAAAMIEAGMRTVHTHRWGPLLWAVGRTRG